MRPLSVPTSEPFPMPFLRATAPADAIIGDSEAIRRVREALMRIAERPGTSVLLKGEIGTGKALAARVIHTNSRGAGAPFILMTCSALPEPLIEHKLFGYEFAGLDDIPTPRRGLLEQADGGTLMLDEVAELSPSIQAKLLSFLQNGSFRRVGGRDDLRVDVSVIAATSHELELDASRGSFDRDLLERLQRVQVQLPPLRDRHSDVPLIVRHFVEVLNSELGRRVEHIDPDVLDRLESYDWPGNVRELRNCLERAMLLCEHDTLHTEDLGPFAESTHLSELSPTPRFQLPEGGVRLEDVERQLVTQALERTGWNQTRAGELLGLNRDRIRYRIMKFGLRPRLSPEA